MSLRDIRKSSAVATLKSPAASPAKAESRVNWLLVAVVVVAIYFIANRQTSPDPHDDHYEQIDDGQAVNVDDAWMVFVLEKTSPTADQSEAIQDTEYFDSLKSRGMIGYRTYDDDQSEAEPYIEWANGRGLSPPLVALVRDREIVTARPFTGKDSIRRLVE